MRLTERKVWAWMTERCNADEIAAYANVSRQVAVAWMNRAARKFADGPTRKTLRRVA